MNDLQVKQFSHIDLDGVGCVVISRIAFKNHVDVEYCNYDDIDSKVMSFLDSGKYNEYDLVLITDISVNEEVAERLNLLCEDKLVLLDHHETATWLNKYGWAEVKVYREGTLSGNSGTSLLASWINELGLLDGNPKKDDVLEFAETARRYDTWEWKNVYKDEFPKTLSDLLFIQGRYKFCDRFVANPEMRFTRVEQALLESNHKEQEYYIKARAKKMMIMNTPEGYKVGVVYAERFINELGNALAEDNPQLDFAVVINMGTGNISYRSVVDGVDLDEFAASRGGGGHQHASGSLIPSDFREAVAKLLLKG